MKLRKHQLDFAARVIYTGTGLAAHEVGAGKTAALIAAGMYLKNLGAIHKAVFVVPNPLVGQWATEFYRFFPQRKPFGIHRKRILLPKTATATFLKSPPENMTQ